MPEAYTTLREKFMCFEEGREDDGIQKALTILLESEWKIDRGCLKKPNVWNFQKHTIGDQVDARDFLVDEWDYTY